MELVSVLMPCRNAAPWIGSALDSVLQQDWGNFEIIVVDDGSVDGSFEIARKFASARCQVVRRSPSGAAAARNHAFALAQGDCIQFLDADDLLAPDKIARQVAALREGGPLTLSWSSVVYLLQDRPDDHARYEAARDPCSSAEEFLACLWGAAGAPGMVAVHQWLASRDLIQRAGPWNELLSVDDDGEFFTRVILAAAQRIAVPQARCYYRKFHHRANLSASGPRGSVVAAARLKAGHLLARTNDEHARRAVSRLLTQVAVDAYPDPAYQRGLDFLRQRGIDLAREVEAPPWFRRAAPLIGWKATRRLQEFARAWRGVRSAVNYRA
jgi:glycosyltransferase involved in cell wall biosynthesis